MALRILIIILVYSWMDSARSEPWAQFRGETGMGVSFETDLPFYWSDTGGIQWAAKLTGRGNSSPAVTRHRVDITTQEADNSLWIVSISRETGEVTHRTKVGAGKLKATGSTQLYATRHNAATPSPIADEDHIWAFFGTGQLVCMEAESRRIIWQRDLTTLYGDYDISFGMASTPRLWRDLIVVTCINKAASYVVAIDKFTGEEKWKTDRQFTAVQDGQDAYSSPVIARSHGKDLVLVSGCDHICAYNLTDGKEVWRSSGLAVNSPFGRIIASPIASHGIVVATSANPQGGGIGHMLAISINRHREMHGTTRLWKFNKSTPDASSPVCINQMVFAVSQNGIATCIDLKSGRVHWQKRISQGTYFASVVAGDDKVYFLSTSGTCTVVLASRRFTEISTNRLSGTFYATPAISDGVIYFRSHERLYAIEQGQW